MPGFNPDKLNIHDLTIEEPEVGSDFDLEKELTDSDWICATERFKELRRETDRNAEDKTYMSLLKMAAQMKIIGEMTGKDLPELPIEPIKRIIATVSSQSGQAMKFGHDVAGYVSILGFEYPHNTQHSLDQIRRLSSGLPVYLAEKSAMQLISGQEAVLTEEEKNNLRDKIGNLSQKKWDSAGLIKYLAELKILQIDIDVEIQDEKIQQALELSHDYRNDGKWERFVDVLFWLSILSAAEIRILENGGLELVNHKKPDFRSKTPQMPEQKQF